MKAINIQQHRSVFGDHRFHQTNHQTMTEITNTTKTIDINTKTQMNGANMKIKNDSIGKPPIQENLSDY